MTPQISMSHARNMLQRVTRDDDGAHAEELVRLLHGLTDSENCVAVQMKKELYMLTADFDAHFQAFLSSGVALSAVAGTG